MSDVVVLTVDRDMIVRAAQAAIQETRLEGLEVPTGEVRRLMRVARTAPEFAIGNWHVGRCGCLVGNLLGAGGLDEMTEAQGVLGLAFDVHLRERLPEEDRVRVVRARRQSKFAVARVSCD